MMNRRRAALVIFGVAIGLAGCNGSTPLPPTAPQTVQPPPTPTPNGVPPGVLKDYTLSGVVFEMTPTGRLPIEGVEIYCEPCGAETHTWATSDANGFYSFTGIWNPGVTPIAIFVSKDGYTDPVGVVPSPYLQGPGWRDVTISGDTRFDIELVKR